MKSTLYIVAILSFFLLGTTAYAAEKVTVCGVSFNKPTFVKGTIKEKTSDLLSCTFTLGKWEVSVFDKKNLGALKSQTKYDPDTNQVLEEPEVIDFPGGSDYLLVFENFNKILKSLKAGEGVVSNLAAGGFDGIQKKYIKKKGKTVGAVFTRRGGFPFELNEEFNWLGGFDFFFQPNPEKLVWVTRSFDVSKDPAVKKCKCVLDLGSYDETNKKTQETNKRRDKARTTAVKVLLKQWSSEIVKLEAMVVTAK